MENNLSVQNLSPEQLNRIRETFKHKDFSKCLYVPFPLEIEKSLRECLIDRFPESQIECNSSLVR